MIHIFQRIVNVSGFDNNCGSHTLLHAFHDNFDNINWNLPQCQHLLQIFSDHYHVAATPENFRKALNAIPGYVNKEYAFGPIFRQHMAEILKNDEAYKNSETLLNQFETAIR